MKYIWFTYIIMVLVIFSCKMKEEHQERIEINDNIEYDTIQTVTSIKMGPNIDSNFQLLEGLFEMDIVIDDLQKIMNEIYGVYLDNKIYDTTIYKLRTDYSFYNNDITCYSKDSQIRILIVKDWVALSEESYMSYFFFTPSAIILLDDFKNEYKLSKLNTTSQELQSFYLSKEKNVRLELSDEGKEISVNYILYLLNTYMQFFSGMNFQCVFPLSSELPTLRTFSKTILRVAPSFDSDKVEILPYNQKLIYLENTNRIDTLNKKSWIWYKVKTQDEHSREGWIFGHPDDVRILTHENWND